MNKKCLRCPCGIEIEEVIKMSMRFYKHKTDKKYCKLLCDDKEGDGWEQNLDVNFKEFLLYYGFKIDLQTLVVDNKINKKSKLIMKLMNMERREKALKDFLRPFKTILQEYQSNFVFVFGYMGEYLLKSIGIKLESATLEKSLIAIDLKLNIKSDYDEYIKEHAIEKELMIKSRLSEIEKLKEKVKKGIEKE